MRVRYIGEDHRTTAFGHEFKRGRWERRRDLTTAQVLSLLHNPVFEVEAARLPAAEPEATPEPAPAKRGPGRPRKVLETAQ